MTASKKKILCFGDSLTAGYTDEGYYPYSAYLSELLEERFQIDHIGLCGWTTSEMVEWKDIRETFDCFRNEWPGLQYQLDHHRPYEMVCMLASTNDIGTGVDADDIIENIDTLVEIAIERCNRVALILVPPCGLEKPDSRLFQVRKKVNEAIVAIAAKYGDKAVVVDTTAALPNGRRGNLTPEVRALWCPDELHLSEKGSTVLAETVFNAIGPLLR